MKRTLPLVLAGAGLLILAAAGLRAVFAPGPVRALGNCDATDGEMDASEQQMLDLVNQARAAGGFSPLVHSPTLGRAAAWKSGDPSAGGTGFSHTDSLGRDPFRRMADCGYARGGGENIAYGNTSPQGIFGMWMASPGHKAAILMPSFKAVGIGRRGVYWTMDFGYAVESGTPPPATVPTQPPPTATPTRTPTPSPAPLPTQTVVPQQYWRVALPMVGNGN